MGPRDIGGKEEERQQGGPSRTMGSGEVPWVFPLHSATVSLLGFLVWSPAFWGPPLAMWVLGAWVGEKMRGQQGGHHLRLEDQGERTYHFLCLLGPRETAGVPDLILHPPRPEALLGPSCCG